MEKGNVNMARFVVAKYDTYEGRLELKEFIGSSVEEVLLSALDITMDSLGETYPHTVEGIKDYSSDCDFPVEIIQVGE